MVLLKASGATSVELVRAIGITDAQRRLHVPMAREQPLIAIGDTRTYIPSFIVSSALRLGQDAERKVHVLDVVFAGKSMHSEEAASEALACPPAVFRLHIPDAHLLASGKLPRIERGKQLCCLLLGDAYLNTCVKRCRSPT